MIDTGGTIAKAAEALHGRRRRRTSSSPPPTASCPTRPSTGCRTAAPARSIVTNTLPIGEDKQFQQLTVLSIAPLLASAIREVFEDGSVTGLFDGSRVAGCLRQ